jgi:hypothetical protein
MRFTYFLLPAVATCLVSSAFSAPNGQDEKLVTMTMDSGGNIVEKVTLSTRVQGVEDRLDKLEKGKGLRTNNPLHGYVNLDILCWKGRGNDQTYAVVSDAAPVATEEHPFSAKTQKAKNNWKPGSRLDVGFTTMHDWNVGAIWTYYHNESVSRKSTTAYAFYPIWASNNYATRGKFHYNLNYNTVDLQFASNLSLSRNLTFKPFVDVRAAWIKSTDRIRYKGLPAVDAGIPTDTTISVSHGWWGIGPRVGTGAAFKFGKCGLSFFGDLSGSLLYGNAHNSRTIDQNIMMTAYGDQSTAGESLNWRDNSGDLRPSLEMMIGANYKWNFDCGKKAICLHAAWETNYWWSQADSFTTIDGEGTTDLTLAQVGKHFQSLILYGINVGLGFEY